MSTAPSAGASPARSSIRRRRRCASGTPRVWMPTRATRERSGLASMISCAMRVRVRLSASSSSRTLPTGASTAFKAQAGSTVCGHAGAYDSFPASLVRAKGVRSRGSLTRPPDDALVQRGPLPGVEVPRLRVPFEAELRLALLEVAPGHNGARAVSIGPDEEGLIRAALRGRNQRLRSPLDAQDRSGDGGRRRKDARGQAPRDRKLEPRTPERTELCRRPDGRSFGRESPLNDHVGRLERNARIEQTPEDCCAAVERQVRNNFERLARERQLQGVSRVDVHRREPLAQPDDEAVVDLHGHDPRRAPQERGGQNAAAGAEVDNEVPALYARSSNQLRCKLATAEKVLAADASGSRSDGHGRPPRP